MKKQFSSLETYSHNFYARGVEPALDQILMEELHCSHEIPAHRTDGIQLFYFVEGQGTFTVNGLELSVRPGMLARVFPYHICSLQAELGQTMVLLRCSFPLSIKPDYRGFVSGTSSF